MRTNAPPPAPQSYCSTVPIAPLLTAYDNLSRQLNVTGFNMSRYATSENSSTNGTVDARGSNATAASVAGGGPLVVSSPYCLVAMRGGSYFTNGVLQCMGLGCIFVEGSQSYT